MLTAQQLRDGCQADGAAAHVHAFTSGAVAQPAVDASAVTFLEEVDKRLKPVYEGLAFLREEAREARERAEGDAREARADRTSEREARERAEGEARAERKADREARERAEGELRRRLDDLQTQFVQLLARGPRNG